MKIQLSVDRHKSCPSHDSPQLYRDYNKWDHPKRKLSSSNHSNHPFSGTKLTLVSGRVRDGPDGQPRRKTKVLPASWAFGSRWPGRGVFSEGKIWGGPGPVGPGPSRWWFKPVEWMVVYPTIYRDFTHNNHVVQCAGFFFHQQESGILESWFYDNLHTQLGSIITYIP